MKIEIGNTKPEAFKENWPGEYQFFSYFEYACGIPHSLFMITTYKENGKPNACFHSWSSFSGDGGGFFAVMPGIGQGTQTYENIMRTKEFCINFLRPDYYDACIKTIENNEMETDEFAVAGFTVEKSSSIASPRIAESFLSLECKLHSVTDLSEKGITAMIVGQVCNIAVLGDYAKGYDKKYSEQGFMFNVNEPKDLSTGVAAKSTICVLSKVGDK